MTKTQDIYHALLAQKVIGELAKRNIEGFYCETGEAALQMALTLIPKGSVVSYGGSQTLREIGLQTAFQSGDYRFLDPNGVDGAAAKNEVARQAFDADYYFMSANAISVSGELVNLDGFGNRTASLMFGPRHVIVIAGMNKVVPTAEVGILRAKQYAAPNTLLLFKQEYPSYDALMQLAESAYSHVVVTGMSTAKGRIKVILVGEYLGF